MTTLVDDTGGGVAVAETPRASAVVADKSNASFGMVASDARVMVAVDPETHRTAVVCGTRATRVVDRNAPPQVVVSRHEPEAVAVQPQTVTRLVLAGFSGQPGERGPAGPAGADAFFTFTQPTPSNEWPITHGLGKFPSVSVVDSAGHLGLGSTRYVDSNNVILSFAAPFAGKAYLN